ncbi:hypothetical protein VTO73DRAFT_12098 [Trametes versicolor]
MEPLKHVLFLPMNMWGHTRPMCTLAARFVRLRPVSVTLFVGTKLLERAAAELAADFLPGEAHLLARVRFVPLAHDAHPIDGSVYEASFLAAWASLSAGSALAAHSVSLGPDGAPVPHSTSVDLRSAPLAAAVVDMFMIAGFRAIHGTRARAHSPTEKEFALHVWLPIATNCMGAWFAEDRAPEAEALAARTGVSVDVAAHQILVGVTGRVLRCAYLPPIYDHELHPQDAPFLPEFCGRVLIQVPSVLRAADGALTMDASAYHPGAASALRAQFGARPAVYAGPLISRGPGAPVTPAHAEVQAFLTGQLRVRGEWSVLMISFGSMFWPSDPAKLQTVLDVLVEADVPFVRCPLRPSRLHLTDDTQVMSCASPFSAISDETKSRLNASGNALLADWVPQEAVLKHAATGWCLTHAGHNSVLECIDSNVPMILWPIDADQSTNAIHLSRTLRIAYELLEVRNGVGLGPIHETGVAPAGTLDAVRTELRGVLSRAFGSERGEGEEHIAVCPIHLYGHARPLAILAARMVKLRPVTVTFFVAAKLLDGVKAEAARDFEPCDADAAARLKFLPIEQGPDPMNTAEYLKNFLATWNSLLEGGCATTQSLDGTLHNLDFCSAPPTVLILDLMAVSAFNALHNALNKSYKIYTWVAISTDSVLTLFRKDLVPDAEAAAALHGTSFDDEAHKLMWAPTGRLLESPCMPDMYDHEIGPQGLDVPPWFSGQIFIRMARVLQETDGVITFDAAGYHPEATAAFRDWFSETSRRVYFAGPLVAMRRAEEQDRDGVLAFLDTQLESRGERCVVYISFGSLFWPSDPAKFHAVLSVLIERNIPFVLARPSPFAAMLDDTKATLAAYDKVFVADWVPQQAVLNHEATGWCLTHGGHNSVLECILAGVPMILWPIVVDQPINALYLTTILNAAYELLEVRHGSGLAPIHHSGQTPLGTIDAVQAEARAVLARAFGADGAQKRARLGALRQAIRGSWEEGGSAVGDVEEFLDGLV